jgi:hypothetical protein
MPTNHAPATPSQLAAIEGRLKADIAEYGPEAQYDQSIRDRAALLALVKKQAAPLDLHELLPQVTQTVRDLTIYASPAHIARVALEAVALAGYGNAREAQARLAAVQQLVDQVIEADREFGRTTSASGCVSVHQLQGALTGYGK